MLFEYTRIMLDTKDMHTGTHTSPDNVHAYIYYIYIYIYIYIPGHVISKPLKVVLDTSLLNTQQYKLRIEGKLKQCKERSNSLPYTLKSY